MSLWSYDGPFPFLTLLLDAISLPIVGPGCRDVSTSLQLFNERQHGLVAQVKGGTDGCIRVKPRPLTRAGDDLHVAAQSMDVPSETVVLLGATDLKQELQGKAGR